MYYADEAVYEGEWFGDKRNGRGLLRLGMQDSISSTGLEWCPRPSYRKRNVVDIND